MADGDLINIPSQLKNMMNPFSFNGKSQLSPDAQAFVDACNAEIDKQNAAKTAAENEIEQDKQAIADAEDALADAKDNVTACQEDIATCQESLQTARQNYDDAFVNMRAAEDALEEATAKYDAMVKADEEAANKRNVLKGLQTPQPRDDDKSILDIIAEHDAARHEVEAATMAANDARDAAGEALTAMNDAQHALTTAKADLKDAEAAVPITEQNLSVVTDAANADIERQSGIINDCNAEIASQTALRDKEAALYEKCMNTFSFSSCSDELKDATKIQIVPSQVEKALNKDLTKKILYGIEHGGNDYFVGTRENLTFDTILATIPKIQIREFQPDPKVNAIWNMMKDVWHAITGTADADIASGATNWNFDAIYTAIKNVGSYVVDPAGFIAKLRKGARAAAANKFIDMQFESTFDASNEALVTSVYNFPFAMYYRLMQSTTTNIYELPCVIDNKMLMQSDGTPGWSNTQFGIMSMLPDWIKNMPVVGSLLNSAVQGMAANFNISFVKWWEGGGQGANTKEPEISFSFDLFNDSAEAAAANFVFVNSLIANNKWIQYDVFQHSPALYDIKIAGSNRLFMCGGKFDVEYKGVMRQMPYAFFDKYLIHYYNTSLYNIYQLINQFATNDVIRIPDVYHVTLRFESLLPANYNTFMFRYVANGKITDYMSLGLDRRSTVTIDSVLSASINGAVDAAKKAPYNYMSDDEYKKQVRHELDMAEHARNNLLDPSIAGDDQASINAEVSKLDAKIADLSKRLDE